MAWVKPKATFVLAMACVLAAAMLWGCGKAPDAAPASSAGAPSSSASASSAPASSSALPGEPSVAPAAAEVIGEGEWGDLFESLGDDALAFGRRVQGELPQTAYVRWDGVGGGEPVTFDDPAQIRALFNALAAISLAGEADEVLTDDYTQFGFTFADGGRFAPSFDSMAIDLPGDDSYTFYSIDAGDDLLAFIAIARQRTMESYGS